MNPSERLEAALSEVLERLDQDGRVDAEYLRGRFGDLAAAISDCLELDVDLRRAAPPRVLGEFRIVRLLGSGARSRVYEGVPLAGGEPVALKVIHPTYLSIPDVPDVTACALALTGGGDWRSHPGVAGVRQVFIGEHAGHRLAVLVCDLIAAPTLKKRLSEAPIGVRAVLRVGADVADTLAALHAVGIVHGNLTSGNVVVADDGSVKLMDVGIASLRGAGARRTAPEEFVGSCAFAAPEVLNPSWGGSSSKLPDSRVDLFALGVLVFEALSGVSPWGRARNECDPLRRHALGAHSVSELMSGIPPDVDALLQRLLAPRPSARPSSAADVGRELRGLAAAAADEPATRRPLADEADAALRRALLSALDGRPAAVVLVGSDGPRLDALLDSWCQRVRRGALETRLRDLAHGLPATSEGFFIATAPRLSAAESSVTRALASFAGAWGATRSLAVATMVAAEPPQWLLDARNAGAVRIVAVDAAEADGLGSGSRPARRDGALTGADRALLVAATQAGPRFHPDDLTPADGETRATLAENLRRLARETGLFRWDGEEFVFVVAS